MARGRLLGALRHLHGGAWRAESEARWRQDVGEKGLRLTAALNKCERFRNVGLKKGAPRADGLLSSPANTRTRT